MCWLNLLRHLENILVIRCTWVFYHFFSSIPSIKRHLCQLFQSVMALHNGPDLMSVAASPQIYYGSSKAELNFRVAYELIFDH